MTLQSETTSRIGKTETSQTIWFVLVAFFSAFFLFLAQPMIAKAIIPEYGGTASVWNSAMMVGQIVLLMGNFYAFGLLDPGQTRKRAIHIAVVGAILTIALLIPVHDMSDPVPDWIANKPPEIAVPLLILASIGPAMLLLSTQSPIIQHAWASATNNSNPYPLFIASNAGSLTGLMAYPFVFEPLFTISQHFLIWEIGFGITMLISACLVFRSWMPGKENEERARPDPAPLSLRTRAEWFARAMIAVIIMMSAGQALTTDVMAMPIAWVLPLAAFLIGYMTAFSSRQGSAFKRDLKIPQAGIIILAAIAANPLFLAYPFTGILSLVAIGVTTHGIVRPAYENRPEVSRLAEFYLMLALGGAAGGFISAVIAPSILEWRWELPAALIGAALLISETSKQDAHKFRSIKKTAIAIGLAALMISIFFQAYEIASGSQLGGVFLTMAAAAMLMTDKSKMFAIWTGLTMIGTGLVMEAGNAISGDSRRSYYGIMAIEEKDFREDKARLLIHGSTIHGMQIIDKPQQPTTYYTEKSGIGDAMKWARTVRPNADIAVAGLGAGTIACLAPKQANMVFYEVDPEVIKAARQDFAFLKKCSPKADIIEGDARISIENDRRSFDMIILDAFSSDTIPMHLVTREALEIYISKLKKDGWLIVHTSNRYLDVSSPVIGWAIKNGYRAQHIHNRNDTNPLATDSNWVAIRPQGWRESEGAWNADSRWKPGESGRIWTDDKSSILDITKPF